MKNFISQVFKPVRMGARASFGFLLLRCVAGLAFMLHGVGKIQNPFGWMGEGATTPAFLQALAALAEFGGGLAWILGLLTPIASFGLACTMAVAAHLHAVTMKQPFVPSPSDSGSYELPAVYLVIAILLMLAGPGKFSLDRLIFGEKGT